MTIRPINPSYHVTGQIKPADLAGLAAKGYVTVICMRPDGEGWGQPSFAAIQQAGAACGLACHYLPVMPGAMPLDQARQLRAILDGTEGPVLAYCASGNRATVVHQMALQAAG